MNTQQIVQQITELFADEQADPGIRDETLKAILRNHQPGPTGVAPIVGDPADKGELRASLTWEPAGTLLLNFGARLSFLRMTRDQAIAFMHGIEAKLNER